MQCSSMRTVTGEVNVSPPVTSNHMASTPLLSANIGGQLITATNPGVVILPRTRPFCHITTTGLFHRADLQPTSPLPSPPPPPSPVVHAIEVLEHVPTESLQLQRHSSQLVPLPSMKVQQQMLHQTSQSLVTKHSSWQDNSFLSFLCK